MDRLWTTHDHCLIDYCLLWLLEIYCFNVSLFEYKPLVYILSQGLVANSICPYNTWVFLMVCTQSVETMTRFKRENMEIDEKE